MLKLIGLLIVSNVFMTLAWYGHLKNQNLPLWKAILVSWLIAFVEYCFMIPANRFGAADGLTTFHLRMVQEVVSLIIFTLIAVFYLGDSLKWNHLVSFCFMICAVYFMFRK